MFVTLCLLFVCNSNPMTALGAHPHEVPSAAGNTQADDTLPSIGVRGGANCWITPGLHTQQFEGAQQKVHGFGSTKPPPPPWGTPPLTSLETVEHPLGLNPGQRRPPCLKQQHQQLNKTWEILEGQFEKRLFARNLFAGNYVVDWLT